MQEAVLPDGANNAVMASSTTTAPMGRLALSPPVCDSIAGALAGAFSILVSQPLDTVRVRMQQQHGHGCNGTLAALRDMVKREGVLSPWKGLSYPLAFAALQSAIMFQSYGVAMRYLSTQATPTAAAASLLQSAHSKAEQQQTSQRATSSSVDNSIAVTGFALPQPVTRPEGPGHGLQGPRQLADTALSIPHNPGAAGLDTASSSLRPWYSLFGFAGSHADSGDGCLHSSDSSGSLDCNSSSVHSRHSTTSVSNAGTNTVHAVASNAGVGSRTTGHQAISMHDGATVVGHHASTQLPLPWHGFLAGVFAGLAQVFLWSPVELLKLRVQLQSSLPAAANYIKPLQMARQVLKLEGFRGLYRGLTITVIRDLPSFGVYFWTYHVLCQRMEPQVHPEQATAITQALSGAGAGIFAWLAIYPLDVVKSRMQAVSAAASPRGATWMTFASQAYKQGGLRTFGRGLAPTLARAAVMDAALFMAYSRVLGTLHEL